MGSKTGARQKLDDDRYDELEKRVRVLEVGSRAFVTEERFDKRRGVVRDHVDGLEERLKCRQDELVLELGSVAAMGEQVSQRVRVLERLVVIRRAIRRVGWRKRVRDFLKRVVGWPKCTWDGLRASWTLMTREERFRVFLAFLVGVIAVLTSVAVAWLVWRLGWA